MSSALRRLGLLLLAFLPGLALAEPKFYGAAAEATGGAGSGERVVVNTIWGGPGSPSFERVCPDPTPDEQVKNACDLKTAASRGDRSITFSVAGLIDLGGGGHRRPGLEQQHHLDQAGSTHGAMMPGPTDSEAPRTPTARRP